MISRSRLAEIRAMTGGQRVAVVGDLMLDEFLSGSVDRISPEAPVPVLAYRSQQHVLGGAGNAARTLLVLGAVVDLVGFVGDDPAGALLLAEVETVGLGTGGVVVTRKRTTTLKTRVIAQTQQIVRIDREASGALVPADRRAMRGAALAAIAEASGVLVSDYDKGALPAALGRELLAACRDRDIPCVVDSKAGHDAYRGATVLTPNVGELARLAHIQPLADADIPKAAGIVFRRFSPAALLVTRSEAGMSLFRPGSERVDVPALATEVRDVTGAGDTVAAVMALGLASGLDLAEAARLATLAAAVVVRKTGTAAPTWSEMAALAEE